jgi:hypothetical protein
LTANGFRVLSHTYVVRMGEARGAVDNTFL